MSSGMNLEEARELASRRSYRWAIKNVKTGLGISFRKATMIKLRELADIADRLVTCRECDAYMTDGYTEGCGFCGYHHSVVKADDFCSYGERKDDE